MADDVISVDVDRRSLQSKLGDEPALVSVEGVELQLDPAWATEELRLAISSGVYERTERDILERTLDPGDQYLELGAGTGLIMTCACRIVGDQHVVAFEADPRLAVVAEINARHNGYAPLVVNAAVVPGSGGDKAHFYRREPFTISSLDPSGGGTPFFVPTVGFRGALARWQPSYLMIDVEGAEVKLLSDTPLLATVRSICVETHQAVVGLPAIQLMLVKLIQEGFALDLAISRGGIAYLTRDNAEGS